jgi:hypothetical protein
VSLLATGADASMPAFRRADVNGDGDVNLSDAVVILMYLYVEGARPSCLKGADVDDDGSLGIADPIRLLNYLVRGGIAPPAPFADCGVDPTWDPLGCDSYPLCDGVSHGEEPAPR